MRERQQMASRPFASVAVALELGGDQEELLQVSVTYYTRAPAREGGGKHWCCVMGKHHSAASEERVFICASVQRFCGSCRSM